MICLSIFFTWQHQLLFLYQKKKTSIIILPGILVATEIFSSGLIEKIWMPHNLFFSVLEIKDQMDDESLLNYSINI